MLRALVVVPSAKVAVTVAVLVVQAVILAAVLEVSQRLRHQKH